MGFICELPSGSGPCFTTLSTIPSMGYDSTCVLASSLCASSCLSDSSCAGIYVSRETECTLLTYKSQMSWSLAASDLQSTHIFHKGLLYQSSYYQFQEGLTENELCLIPIASPIVTTQIPGEITTGQINPTPALNTRETDTHLETASDSCSNSSLDCIAQLRTLSTSEEQGAAQTSQVDNLATDSLNMIMNLNNQSSTVNNSSALSVVFDNNASTLNTSEVTLFTVHSEDTEFTTLAAKINPYTQTIEVKAPDDNGIFGTSNNTLLLHISTIDNIATLSITDIPHTQTVADSTLDDNGPLNTFYSTSLLYTSSTDSIMNSDNDSSMISVVNSSQNVTTGYLNAKEDMPLFNSSICFCICKETTENLQEKLKKISLNLKLDTASLSSVLRRKVSADDPRPISRESCRFELHTSKLSWDKAHQACKQRGLTLASLSKGAELQSMATVVKQADEMHSKKYNLESSHHQVDNNSSYGFTVEYHNLQNPIPPFLEGK
ncbi:uncharacterized protein LOC134244895 [Saccostrea cucullata]|uniref:uncharacterized protein LOC134244895 n=1 Tax=Saccostrea cuccullata TaxID=36930 RepID=UPI002ED247A8